MFIILNVISYVVIILLIIITIVIITWLILNSDIINITYKIEFAITTIQINRYIFCKENYLLLTNLTPVIKLSDEQLQNKHAL